MTEQFYTVEVVAPRVGLSVQALYSACRQKQFPHIRIGKRIRVPESALRQWIEEQLAKNTNAQVSVNSFEAVN